MKLICIGDSLTFGYGVKYNSRWTNLVSKNTGWEIVNLGVNGDTVGGMLYRYGKLTPGKNDVIFIMGGINDIFYSASCETARAGMGGLIMQLLSSGINFAVGIPMRIGSGFYPGAWSEVVDFEGAMKLIDEYREWLMKFCTAFSVKYIDFDDGYDSSCFIDGLHPDEKGHEFMAGKVINWLNSNI